MKEINELIKTKKDLYSSNKKSFDLAKQDKVFASLCLKLGLPEEELLNYTSKLEKTVCELNNCKGCKGLNCCKNELKGFVDYPTVENGNLVFSYTPCKYKKEVDKYKSNVVFYETPLFLQTARIADIYADDKSRTEILKYVQRFMKNYETEKGVYLYGSFGCGKSYILNAILNELSKKGKSCVSIYYPSLLKKLKDSFNNKTTSFEQIFNELETCDYLLIDDIGAENNTPWSRDEILGTLLQSRMDNNKQTFFTSNFSLEELEGHLSETASSTEKIKARRIIERIKQLSTCIALIGENKRNVK